MSHPHLLNNLACVLHVCVYIGGIMEMHHLVDTAFDLFLFKKLKNDRNIDKSTIKLYTIITHSM